MGGVGWNEVGRGTDKDSFFVVFCNCLTPQKSEGTNGQPIHPHGALSEDKSA